MLSGRRVILCCVVLRNCSRWICQAVGTWYAFVKEKVDNRVCLTAIWLRAPPFLQWSDVTCFDLANKGAHMNLGIIRNLWWRRTASATVKWFSRVNRKHQFGNRFTSQSWVRKSSAKNRQMFYNAHEKCIVSTHPPVPKFFPICTGCRTVERLRTKASRCSRSQIGEHLWAPHTTFQRAPHFPPILWNPKKEFIHLEGRPKLRTLSHSLSRK